MLSNKRAQPVVNYYLESKLISCKPVVCYLGIFVDCHLNWNSHCQYVAVKATRSLNFLHHCLFNCSSKVKSASYKCIVRPIMEYACPVWFLHTAKNINCLEHDQHRAARWASGSRWNPSSYCWTKSSDDCLVELKWPSIHRHHVYLSVCQVHDILHHHNSAKHFQLSNNNFTRSHPLTTYSTHFIIHQFLPLFFFRKQSILMEHYSLCHPQDQTVQLIPCRPSSFSFMIFFCNLMLCTCVCIYVLVHICFVIVIFVVNYFYVVSWLVICVYLYPCTYVLGSTFTGYPFV